MYFMFPLNNFGLGWAAFTLNMRMLEKLQDLDDLEKPPKARIKLQIHAT
jgi:hypothetical protein